MTVDWTGCCDIGDAANKGMAEKTVSKQKSEDVDMFE